MMQQKYLVVKVSQGGSLDHDQQESASGVEGVRECEGNVLAYPIPLSAKKFKQI